MESFSVLFPLALVLVGFAFYLLNRSRRVHRAAEGAWYDIQGREIKGKAAILNLQAGLLFVVGGMILVWLLVNLSQTVPTATPVPLTPEAFEASPQITELPPPVRPGEVATSTLSVDALPSLEGAATAEPIPTVPITSQAIITNTNGNGLVLRDAPFGNQLLILEEGSTVYVRGGFMEVQGILWQNVVDLDGREGWVASDYLVYR